MTLRSGNYRLVAVGENRVRVFFLLTCEPQILLFSTGGAFTLSLPQQKFDEGNSLAVFLKREPKNASFSKKIEGERAIESKRYNDEGVKRSPELLEKKIESMEMQKKIKRNLQDKNEQKLSQIGF